MSLNEQLISEAINRAAPDDAWRIEAPPPQSPAPIVMSVLKKRSKQIRIYEEAEVQQFEHELESLSRNSDRRRASEALLKALKEQAPIGYRDYARVPRDFCQRLERLESAFPNFRQAIHQIRLLLTLEKAGRNLLRLPPLLLVGEPGVGKTYFATEFAKAMRLECRVVHMENATSGMLLSGLEQFYATASPGMVFDALVKGRQANPILIVDELDKVSTDPRQPPANALYQLLEPNTAKQFRDQSCLDLALDAGHINWMITANDISIIPPPLLSRMTIVHVPSPTREERLQIAKQVYCDLRKENGWGRHFEANLSENASDLLATIPGSVRRMQSVLRLAFAYAMDRQTKAVELQDLNAALCARRTINNLKLMEIQGHA
ncbi:MAG: AAA family ATPase [Thermomonas sp.]